jgi:hypothetical protein
MKSCWAVSLSPSSGHDVIRVFPTQYLKCWALTPHRPSWSLKKTSPYVYVLKSSNYILKSCCYRNHKINIHSLYMCHYNAKIKETIQVRPKILCIKTRSSLVSGLWYNSRLLLFSWWISRETPQTELLRVSIYCTTNYPSAWHTS